MLEVLMTIMAILGILLTLIGITLFIVMAIVIIKEFVI